MTLAALILAAGRGRRFGSDKRRYLIDGVPMLLKTTQRYRDVFDDVRVVIRPDEDDLRTDLLALDVKVVEADDADAGQSRTLAAGIRDLIDIDQVIVGLGDMPFVEAATLRAMAGVATPRPIVRPRYRGQPGNPIRFDAGLFGELMRIDGDQGAREILKAAPDRVEFFDTDDPGVIQDVDRPLNSAD